MFRIILPNGASSIDGGFWITEGLKHDFPFSEKNPAESRRKRIFKTWELA